LAFSKPVRILLLAASLAAAALVGACQLEEPIAWGTVVSAEELVYGEDEVNLPKYYEHPLAPEADWEIVVQLDDGAAVTLMHNGTRRYEPGERVRLLIDEAGTLLL
jgi:hypothetical protein